MSKLWERRDYCGTAARRVEVIVKYVPMCSEQISYGVDVTHHY